MNIPTKTLLAAGRYLLNKAFAIILLAVLMLAFHGLPEGHAVAFAELLYLAILVNGIAVVAPLLRLLVFPEAAEYGESGALREDLRLPTYTYSEGVGVKVKYPPSLLHYWFATGISYAATIACFATLTH